MFLGVADRCYRQMANSKRLRRHWTIPSAQHTSQPTMVSVATPRNCMPKKMKAIQEYKSRMYKCFWRWPRLSSHRNGRICCLAVPVLDKHKIWPFHVEVVRKDGKEIYHEASCTCGAIINLLLWPSRWLIAVVAWFRKVPSINDARKLAFERFWKVDITKAKLHWKNYFPNSI